MKLCFINLAILCFIFGSYNYNCAYAKIKDIDSPFIKANIDIDKVKSKAPIETKEYTNNSNGLIDANKVTASDKPKLLIDLVDANEFPNNVKLYCSCSDFIANSITNLAPPYNNDFKNNWVNIEEIIDGKKVKINDFTIDEIREKEAPGFTTTFVMDYSESMALDYAFINNSLKQAVKYLRPEKDDYEIVQFDNRIKKSVNRTNEPNDVNFLIDYDKLAGATAFYSASVFAINEISNSKKNKVAILFTDGKDNASLFTGAQDVIYKARNSNTKVFVIGLIRNGEEHLQTTLNDIAEQCGGKAYFPNSLNELDNIFKDIYHILKVHYLISYTPSDVTMKLRTIKVDLKLPNIDYLISATKKYFSTPDTKDEEKIITAANFPNGVAEFSKEQLEMIEDIAQLMIEDPNKKIRIVGHTDSKGPDIINDQLSLKRAKKLANEFYHFGVSKKQIVAIIGNGKRKLIYENEKTEAERQANRRVDIEML